MPSSNLTALCLRRRETGERDLVVTFLTREQGKLALHARGVRQASARNAAVCQPFALAVIQAATRGDQRGMSTLAQAQIEETFPGLREDAERAAWAAFAVELTDLALPDGEPQPEVFDLLRATLAGMDTAADGAAPACSFALRLLAILGWEPVLDACAACGGALGESEACFDPAAGGLVHAAEADRRLAVPVTPAVVKALRRLLAPEAYGLDPAALTMSAELEAGVRAAVLAHVRCHLDAAPKSLAVLDQLRRRPA
jgi:DNA repair protein RecO (recombination protein O)